MDSCASWPLLVLCLIFVPRTHFLNEDLIGSWWLSSSRIYLLTWEGSKITVFIPSHRSPCPQTGVDRALCVLLGASFGSERPHSSGCPAGAGEEKQEMERVQVALECSWALG